MITAERLRELLDYDPLTGIFRWRVNKGRFKVGDIAKSPTSLGRLRIKIDQVTYLAHRLAWLHVHGEWPKEIDHKDANPVNNAISNLRVATRSQNEANKKKYKGTALKGVTWDRSRQKWKAHICKDQKRMNLGRFDTQEAAHAAYVSAAIRLFGEFHRPA